MTWADNQKAGLIAPGADCARWRPSSGYAIVHEYVDRGVSGAWARRLRLDQLMADARRGKGGSAVVKPCAE